MTTACTNCGHALEEHIETGCQACECDARTETLMPMLYVDNSILRAMSCSTRALMRYGLGYTSVEERAALMAGRAAHAAFAAWFAAEEGFTGETADAALSIFTDSYQAWAEANVPPGDRLTYENCWTILAAWFDAHPREALPFGEVVHVETPLEMPLSEGVTFVGRPDLIARDRDGAHWWGVDTKTTGRIDRDSYRMDSQFSGYTALLQDWLQRRDPEARLVGMMVNAVQFSRLPSDPSRKCKTHGVPYAECRAIHATWEMIPVERNAAQLVEWKKTALHLARRYGDLIARFTADADVLKVRQQGAFFRECPWCECYAFCQVGRPVDRIPSLFVKQPWDPRGERI